MEEFLKSAGYGAIFALSFISAMGLPVGAEVALIYGGVLASGQVPGEGKPLSLAVVIIVATIAELLGSLAGYSIGRYGGRALVDKVGKYVLLTHKDLDRADAWFARRVSPSSSSAASSPCCDPSCPSRPAWVRWRSAGSSSSR